MFAIACIYYENKPFDATEEYHCTSVDGAQLPLLQLSTVWPEILAGRYFGGLLKICHLAEFTLAVKPVLAIMIFIAKWLIECSGILTLP